MTTKIKNIDKNLKEQVQRLNINDILRAPFVNVGSTVQTVRPFNLAERSFCVCMVARAVAKQMGIDDAQITKYALDIRLDCMLSGGGSFDVQGDHVYRGKSREPMSSIECAIVEIAGTMVDINYLNMQGLGIHASETVDALIDLLNTRVSLFGTMHPKFSNAVGAVIGHMDLGTYAKE